MKFIIKSFYIDMKSIVKSYFYLSFMAFLILLVIFSARYFTVKENDINDYRENLYRKVAIRTKLHELSSSESEDETASRYSMKVFGEASRNYTEEDPQQFNLNMAKYYLATWELHTSLSEEWNKMSIYDRKLSPEEYYRENWEHTKKFLGYPTFSSMEKSTADMTDVDIFAMQTLYYQELYKANLEERFSYSTDSWAILYNLNKKWISKILVIISLLLGASIYSKQLEDGIIKTKLSIGVNRKRYLLDTYLISIISAISIFIIPLIFILILQSFKYGLKGYNFPVLIDRYVVENFKPDITLPSVASSMQKLNTIGLSLFVGIGPMKSLLGRVVFIPLWKNLILTLGITLLSIVFWSSLGLIIAVILKGSLKSVTVAFAVYLMTYIPAFLNQNIAGTIFDLPKLTNPVNIVQGFQKVTIPQIVILYLGGAMLLLLIAMEAFKKLDIVK